MLVTLVALGAMPTAALASGGTVEGLRVTRAEGTLAVLNWQTVRGAESYNVYLDDDLAATDTDGWLTLTGLEFLTSYSVSVAAVTDGVEGARSAPVTFETTDIKLGDPRLTLDNGLFKLTSSRVPLAWNDRGPQANIELFRDGVQLDPGALLNPVFVFGRLFDSDVVPGETYVYTARYNSNLTGAKGPFGPEITVTVPLGPSGPPTVVSTYADTSVTVLRIGNLGPGVDRFEVERNGESLGVFTRRLRGETEWFANEVGNFDPDGVYRVRVIDARGGGGPWSDSAPTAPLTLPPLVGTG